MKTEDNDSRPDYGALRRELRRRREPDPAARAERTLRNARFDNDSVPIDRKGLQDPHTEHSRSGDPSVAPQPQNDLEIDDLDIDDAFESNSWGWTKRVLSAPVPTTERQVELAQAIEAGVLAHDALSVSVARSTYATDDDLSALVVKGNAALNEMLEGNLRLVLHWARRYAGGEPTLTEELFQEGYFGLRRAVEGWDWQRGYTFATYATWHIRQTVARALHNTQHTIRIPVHVQEAWAYAKRHHTDLSVAERDALNLVERLTPWEPIVEALSENLAWHDRQFVIPDFSGQGDDQAVYHSLCMKLLNTLSSRSRELLEKRFGFYDDPQTLDAVGEGVGVTRERVRQIILSAVEQIRLSILTSDSDLLTRVIDTQPRDNRLTPITIRVLLDPTIETWKPLLTSIGISRREVNALRSQYAQALTAIDVDLFELPDTLRDL